MTVITSTKQQRFHIKLKRMGWKALGGMVPPDVHNKVMDYKRKLMAKHYEHRTGKRAN